MSLLSDGALDRKWGLTKSSSSGPTSYLVPTDVGSVDDKAELPQPTAAFANLAFLSELTHRGGGGGG